MATVCLAARSAKTIFVLPLGIFPKANLSHTTSTNLLQSQGPGRCKCSFMLNLPLKKLFFVASCATPFAGYGITTLGFAFGTATLTSPAAPGGQ